MSPRVPDAFVTFQLQLAEDIQLRCLKAVEVGIRVRTNIETGSDPKDKLVPDPTMEKTIGIGAVHSKK